MQQLANAVCQVLRGTAANAWGDTTDSFSPYETGVPAAIAEESKTVFDPSTQMPRTVRKIFCVVPAWLDVLVTDTLQVAYYPAAAGTSLAGRMPLYFIEDVMLQPTLGTPPDLILTLRERSATGISSD